MNNTQTATAGARTQWTKPFHGVSHLGEYSLQKRWATVNDHGSFAVLLKWFLGCGFSPSESQHDTADDAKRHSEKWFVATE